MNWGYSLLGIGKKALDTLASVGDFLKEAFSSLVYNITNIIPRFLYMIWRLLAWIVAQIEGIFRNLAGIGTSGKDMVSEIINNQNVGYIFQNLLGLSMALIIFFTIVKIIQEHYKEKDGGNPYKIVLRTFKGLIMFFFVDVAVVVGLYASQVMFKALDAATGGGTATIAGQVFKAMAADANRLRIGRVGEDEGLTALAMNKYYNRITNEEVNPNDGRYVMVEVTDKGKAQTAAELNQKYWDLFPSMRYGVVGSDGETVTPLVRWLSTQDLGEDFKNNWDSSFVDGQDRWNEYDNDGSGSMTAKAGYRNDILQGISTTVQPSISLTWSPIDIYNYGYVMVESEHIQHDQFISTFGTGTNVPMGTTFVKYGDPVTTLKSLEDSAKLFGITMNAGVSLEGSEAAAYFDLDMFDTSKFTQILQTVLLNVVYTNVAKMIVQIVPQVPAATSIFAVNIRYMQVLAPFIFKMIKSVADSALSDLIPRDENGKPLVEAFEVASKTTSHNGNVWVKVNDKSSYLPLVIEQYHFDANFSDLWSQLTDAYADLIRQMESAQEDTWDEAEARKEVLGMMGGKVQDQNEWKAYYGLVNKYNDIAAGLLRNLGNYLYLYDKVNENSQLVEDEKSSQKTDQLNKWGYTGSYSGLENAIKSTFTNLVKQYNNSVSGTFTSAWPSTNYADPRIVSPIYKPIVEFNTTENRAAEMTPTQIKDAMFNQDAKNGKVVVNMIIDDRGNINPNVGAAAYRMIDWNAYGRSSYGVTLKNYTDFYYNKSALSEEDAELVIAEQSYSSFDDLAFVAIDAGASSPENNGWEKQGLRYFTGYQGTYNPFSPMATSGSAGGKYNFSSNGFWGMDGVHINGQTYYMEYKGTSAVVSPDNKGFGSNQSAYSNTEATPVAINTMSSSANLNSEFAANREATRTQLSTMASVDTTTPIATEFARNIVTFRRLDAGADKSNDKKALKEWIKTGDSASVNGTATANMLYAMGGNDPAKTIDDYMANSATGDRRYLMLTQDGEVTADKLGSYVGAFTYTDASTVNALYDFGEINFAVGYIAIVTAVGVYLNFAFGLIQRAVNMAVLYIMSPVTIAFYPFDDGQKFNSSFVTPFYKEAISAYAILISLNLFIVLLSPVQNAVETATGSTALGWVGLIAFTSMLPKIRDSITSLLGANPIAAKSLGSAFNDAKKALGVDAMKSAAKKTAGGMNRLREARNRQKVHKEARNQKEMARLQELQKQNKLGWWGEQRLNKLSGGAASQARIDKARESGKTDGLTKSEVRRMNRQNKAAETRAKQLVGPLKANATAAEKAAYEQRLAQQKSDLLDSKDFKKSVNGVVAATSFGQWANRTGAAVSSKAASGLHQAKNWVNDKKEGLAGSAVGSMGRALGSAAKHTLVGEALAAEFGYDGHRMQKQDSVWGARLRAKDPVINMNDQKNIAAKERARASALNSYKEAMVAAMAMDTSKASEGDAIKANRTKQLYAQEELAKMTQGQGVTSKLRALMMADAIKANENEPEDKRKTKEQLAADVDKEMSGMTRAQLKDKYSEIGGDARLAEGIAKGWKEFEGVGFNIDFDSDAAKARLKEFDKKLNEKAAGGAKEIEVKLSTELQAQGAFIEQMAASIARGMGKENDSKAIQDISKALEKADSQTSISDLVSSLSKNLGMTSEEDQRKVNQALIAADGKGFLQTNGQNKSDIADLRAVLDAQKLYDKGEEMFRNKIGDSIPPAAKEEMLRIYKNVNDTNLNSSNPDSMGYRIEHEIYDKYRAQGGDINSVACQQEVEELRMQMKNELNTKLNQFGQEYAGSIREHEVAQKYKQEMQAVDTMAVMTEYQHEREFHISMNMDVPSIQAVVNDGLIQKLHESGDYANAGLKLQQLVDAIQRHDTAGAKDLGFDEKTIAELTKWEEQGLTKRLEGIRGLGVLDSAHMGSTTIAMGGDTMAGMETALARLSSIAEQKIIIDKFNEAVSAYAGQEANARNMVKQVANSIENTFQGPEYNDLIGQIKDINGNVVRSQKELALALKASLESVNNNPDMMDNQNIKANLEALRNFRSQHPENQTISHAITRYLDSGIAQASVANDSMNLVNAMRNDISSLDAKIRENLAKMKDFQGGK